MGIGIFAVFAGAGRDGNDILANLVPKQPHFPINFRSLIFIVILKMCVENAPFLGTVLLVLACLTLNWANILTFNFTVVSFFLVEFFGEDKKNEKKTVRNGK
jgi:hypothetical protein